MSDPALPPLVLLIGVASIPVGLLAALAFVRLVGPWSSVVVAHGMVLPPPANAHRVDGQTVRIGPRYSIYGLGRITVSKDALWVGFAPPASWLFREVMVPLDEVSLHTPEDWLESGARVSLLSVPGVSLTLRGDGAQLVIARLG